MTKKVSILTALIFLFTLSFGVTIYAQEDVVDTVTSKVKNVFMSRKTWGADESLLVDTSNTYAEPKRIVYVEIEPAVLAKQTDELMRDMYYFFAFKMGLGDIPFHYIQDDSGVVYEASAKGSDVILPIEGLEKGDILVGYISKTGDFENNKSNFVKGAREILSKTGVKPSNVTVENFVLDLNIADKDSKVVLEDIEKDGNDFAKFVEKARPDIEKDLTVPKKEYAVKLGKVEYSRDPKPNSKVQVNIEVENIGDTNIYFDGESELFAATNDEFDHDSDFYIDDVWNSKSRVSIMSEEMSILPAGEGKVFSFMVKAPLSKGEVSDKFILVNRRGDKFKDATFEIKFDIDLGDMKVLEIKDTETGYLRVRKEGRFGSEEIGKVLPGERYEYTERNEGGWIGIKLADGTVGWVSSAYVQIIN